MSKITLLDGSIGQELVRRCTDPATPFWSTSVMIKHPHLLRDLHRAYADAGATVMMTNTYAVLYDRLEQMGDLGVPIPGIVSMALDAACAIRELDEHVDRRVAGALGPLMASYRPDRCPPPDEAERMYADSVAHLVERADLLIFETMSSVEQAEGAMRAGDASGLPYWIAATVEDFDGTKLRSGEALSDLALLLSRYRPQALLINCSRPEAVTDGLAILAKLGLPFGAYANGFTKISDGFLKDAPTVDVLEKRSDLGPSAYADFAMTWVDMGATIIGGCCEVGPAHISEIASRLRAGGHQIT